MILKIEVGGVKVEVGMINFVRFCFEFESVEKCFFSMCLWVLGLVFSSVEKVSMASWCIYFCFSYEESFFRYFFFSFFRGGLFLCEEIRIMLKGKEYGLDFFYYYIFFDYSFCFLS